MSNPAQCEDCGAPTAIIHRMIGWFGLRESYCKYCRTCLANHAAEYGQTVEETLATHDALAAGCQASIEAYDRRRQKNGR